MKTSNRVRRLTPTQNAASPLAVDRLCDCEDESGSRRPEDARIACSDALERIMPNKKRFCVPLVSSTTMRTVPPGLTKDVLLQALEDAGTSFEQGELAYLAVTVQRAR
jgi:hypothetical protein